MFYGIPKEKKKSQFSHYHFLTNNYRQVSKIKIKNPNFKFEHLETSQNFKTLLF